jgi:3-methylfumaryl-CoA hydratase
VDAERVLGLAAVLRVAPPQPGDALPPMWHEVLVRDPIDPWGAGPDGHPSSSATIPPLVNRQRLFGGGRLSVAKPLRVGAPVTRSTRVTEVRARQARSGPLLVVTEEQVWHSGGEECLRDERDLVYRNLLKTLIGARQHDAPSSATRDLTFQTDPTLLFTYSALTANAHRVHYDHRYATEVEGHRDLLVHGPLSVLLASEALRLNDTRSLRSLDYRLVAPAYCGEELTFELSRGPTASSIDIAGFANGVRYFTGVADLG